MSKPIPQLERHCGSWFIFDRATGKVITETFFQGRAQAYADRGFEVVTALEGLQRVNRR